MSLRRKLKRALMGDDDEAIIEALTRKQIRNERARKTGKITLAIINTAATIAGIKIPFIKNINFMKNTTFAIFGEIITRIFSGKPKFFTWAQRVTGLITVVLAALKYLVDPTMEFNWSPKAVEVINYLIVAGISLTGAFQLPKKDLNEPEEENTGFFQKILGAVKVTFGK